MNWLDFISTMVGHLAWPAVFGYLLYHFKDEVKALIPKLTEMSIFGNTVTFQEQLQKAEATAQTVESVVENNANEANTTPPPAIKQIEDEYIALAQSFPEGAVMEAYKEVELVLKNYALAKESMYIPSNNKMLVQRLLQFSPNATSVNKLYQQLTQTRNAAVHNASGIITPSEAIAYRDLCKQFIAVLRSEDIRSRLPKDLQTF